jgi:hypothetical protein
LRGADRRWSSISQYGKSNRATTRECVPGALRSASHHDTTGKSTRHGCRYFVGFFFGAGFAAVVEVLLNSGSREL